MRVLLSALLLSLLLCASCGTERVPIPQEGIWQLELDLGGPVLPFQFDLERLDSTTWSARIHNASEIIPVTAVTLRADSIFLRMPLFDSEFKGKLVNERTIEGHWYNYLKGPDYRVPFVARQGVTERFPNAERAVARVGGNWETHFSQGTNDAYDAIGVFQDLPNGRVSGTFVTETGDYRFLEGVVDEDSLRLSCFDGSHAFLFTAGMSGDSMVGHFWSGTHWHEPWVAFRNPTFELRNPDSLTFLKEGYDMVDFSFPDLDGRPISTSDPRFQGKVLLVQVMGSWCPNCVDETRVLNELYREYGRDGLEVIAIAFEKYPDETKAIQALRRFKQALQVAYPVVHGGRSAKEDASAKLPFLSQVMSYPTCIFVDRSGRVRRIHTGFNGPGTGERFVNYRKDLRSFVEALLKEPAPQLQQASLRSGL